MKLNTLAKTMVLALAVLLATSAFAINKGSLHINEAILVNGQQIPAGDYKLQWDGAGPDVQVSVMRGKKEVAKTSGKLIELDKAADSDTVVLTGTTAPQSLSQVRFGGKKTALNISSSDRASMSDSSMK
jgi:hypothetical protein